MLEFGKFEALFLNAKKPYWVLYKGATKGQQIGSNFSSGKEGEAVSLPSVDESFAELSDLVAIYGDGTYTIECRSHPKASRGNDTHQFFVGDSAVVSAKATVVAQAQNPAIGFFAGLDGRYFMEQVSSKSELLHKTELELLRKEMEVAELKRQLKEDQSQSTLPQQIFGLLEKQPQIIDRLFGGGTAIGLLKSDKPIPEPRENSAQQNDSDEDAYEPGKLDFNALVEAAMDIQRALPHRHVNEIFDGLADMVVQDPEKAEGYLKMLLG